MNLAWVIPPTGDAEVRNVHAPDRKRLAREGFTRFRLEWTSEAGRRQEAAVYAMRVPTAREVGEGAEAIFASGGRGTLRLLDEGGAALVSIPG